MKQIEEQLWDYIDGFCTEEEQKRLSFLIETDENYSSKYAELLNFHENMSAFELDEPSMAFTFKLMEKIRTEKALVPLKTQIDKRIIYAISGFFICIILTFLVFVFVNINWSQSATIKLPQINFSGLNIFSNPVIIKGFLFFDMILVLFFADHYFRKWFLHQK